MTTGEIVKALRETESRSKRELLDEAAKYIEDLTYMAAALTTALQIVVVEKLNEQERKELNDGIIDALRCLKNAREKKWN